MSVILNSHIVFTSLDSREMINYIFEHRFEWNVQHLLKFKMSIFEDTVHAYGRIKTNQSFNVKRESVKIYRRSIENITSHVCIFSRYIFISIIIMNRRKVYLKEIIFYLSLILFINIYFCGLPSPQTQHIINELIATRSSDTCFNIHTILKCTFWTSPKSFIFSICQHCDQFEMMSQFS